MGEAKRRKLYARDTVTNLEFKGNDYRGTRLHLSHARQVWMPNPATPLQQAGIGRRMQKTLF